MPARRFVIHLLELVVLSALVSVRAANTSLTITSPMKRADCTAHSAPEDIASQLNTTISGVPCSRKENIRHVFHTNASYVQSGHIVVINAAIAFSLLVFRSALRAMTWDALRASMILGALHRVLSGNVESDGGSGEGVAEVEVCVKGSRVDVVGHGQGGEESTGGEKDSDVQQATQILASGQLSKHNIIAKGRITTCCPTLPLILSLSWTRKDHQQAMSWKTA
jgi:hypothetical protein